MSPIVSGRSETMLWGALGKEAAGKTTSGGTTRACFGGRGFGLKLPGPAGCLGDPGMIFTTYWFLLFAVVTIVVFRLLPWAAARQGWLAAACAVFHYHFAGPAGVKPIIVLMILTYLAGLSRRRAAGVAAMAACVGALCFYKYSLFLIGAAIPPLSAGLAATPARLALHAMPGAPPLGVSFFA